MLCRFLRYPHHDRKKRVSSYLSIKTATGRHGDEDKGTAWVSSERGQGSLVDVQRVKSNSTRVSRLFIQGAFSFKIAFSG